MYNQLFSFKNSPFILNHISKITHINYIDTDINIHPHFFNSFSIDDCNYKSIIILLYILISITLFQRHLLIDFFV